MKKSELQKIINEEIKTILMEGSLKSTTVKKSVIDYIDAFIEDINEHLDMDVTDPYTDEFDAFITELYKLVDKLKATVKSYKFKSIK